MIEEKYLELTTEIESVYPTQNHPFFNFEDKFYSREELEGLLHYFEWILENFPTEDNRCSMFQLGLEEHILDHCDLSYNNDDDYIYPIRADHPVMKEYDGLFDQCINVAKGLTAEVAKYIDDIKLMISSFEDKFDLLRAVNRNLISECK